MEIFREAWWWFVAAAAPGVIALVVAVVLGVKLRRLRRAQQIALGDGGSADLIAGQADLASAVRATQADLSAARDEMARVSARTDEALRTATRFHGVVRYDAYRDMGGRQSWSVASIDRESNGTVLTALHGREDTRLFVKELTAGAPDRELSPEEERALESARAHLA